MGGKQEALLTWPTVEALFYSILSERQEEYEVGVCVSTLIVIYKAANKEEWG